MSRDTYYAAGIVVTERADREVPFNHRVHAFINVTGVTLDHPFRCCVSEIVPRLSGDSCRG